MKRHPLPRQRPGVDHLGHCRIQCQHATSTEDIQCGYLLNLVRAEREITRSHRPFSRGRGVSAWAICAMIGLVRFSSFFSATRKRLVRSIIVVTLAGPYFCRNSTRSFDRLSPRHRARRSCLTPVSELLAMRDDVRAEQDAEFRANLGGGRLRSRYPDGAGGRRAGGATTQPGGLHRSRHGDRWLPGRPGAGHLRNAFARRSARGSSQSGVTPTWSRKPGSRTSLRCRVRRPSE